MATLTEYMKRRTIDEIIDRYRREPMVIPEVAFLAMVAISAVSGRDAPRLSLFLAAVATLAVAVAVVSLVVAVG